MTRHARGSRDAITTGALDELQRLYARSDALVVDATCACTDGNDVEAALCCHFGKIGREPHVTAIEMRLVAHAIAARGGLPGGGAARKRRLQVLDEARSCPLLTVAGRCSIYASRPLGCRTFFCEGHGPSNRAATRRDQLEIARRIADLSARVFPRDEGPRPFTRALASLAPRG